MRCNSRPRPLAASSSRRMVVRPRLDDAGANRIAIAASDGAPADAVAEATGLLQAAGLAVYVVDDAPGLVVTRTVAMLVAGIDAGDGRGRRHRHERRHAAQHDYPWARWPGRPLTATIVGILRRDPGLVPQGPLPPVALLRRIAARRFSLT